MYNRFPFARLLCGAAAMILTVAAGCQSTTFKSGLNPFQSSVEETPEEEMEAAPTRMAVIWKETAVSPVGGKATRGFGGRVYFYNNANEPVRANGELTVYAFDDSGMETRASNVPDRKYVFRAEDMDNHFSETELGPSYSIWLPWDKVGGMRKTVALMPVFKPVNGRIVQSGQSIAVLPGKTADNQVEDIDDASLVRQVTATVPPGERDTVARLGSPTDGRTRGLGRPRTTTIRVPRTMANRMKYSRAPATRTPAIAPARTRQSGEKPATTAETASTETETPAAAPAVRPVFGQPGSWR